MTGFLIKYIENCCKLSDLSFLLIIMPSELCSLVSIIVLVMVIIANILLIFTSITWRRARAGCKVDLDGQAQLLKGITWEFSCYEMWTNPPVWWTDHPSVASFLTFRNFSKLFSDDCKYFWGFQVHLITTFSSCSFLFCNLGTYVNNLSIAVKTTRPLDLGNKMWGELEINISIFNN